MIRVAIVGTGYVGLVTGACLSELGHRVVCVDTDKLKIRNLQNRQIPIYEPGLAEIVSTNQARGLLTFTNSMVEAVTSGVDLLFVAVGTPSGSEEGKVDLREVFAAVHESGQALAMRAPSSDSSTAIVMKSTS